MNLSSLMGSGSTFATKAEEISPLLMAMGSHLMTPPAQRDPRTLMLGMAAMQQQKKEQAEVARQKMMQEQLFGGAGGQPGAALPGGLVGSLAQSGKIPPELAQIIPMMPPEQAMETLAGLMGPQEQKRYNVGGALVDASGNEIYKAQERPEIPSIIREAQELFPGDEAKQREYVMQYRQKSGVHVNVDTGEKMPQVGTIPQGWELRQTETGWRMEPIEGGPAAVEQQQAAAQRQEQETQVDRYGNIVLDDIGRVREMVEAAPLTTTGLGGSLLQNLPGTAAHDASRLLNTITTNVGFDKLQQMRKASPTGGALGAVSDRENEMLKSALGALEQSQSKEQFVQNLDRLEDVYLGIVHGPVEQKQRIDGRLIIKVGGEWYEVAQ